MFNEVKGNLDNVQKIRRRLQSSHGERINMPIAEPRAPTEKSFGWWRHILSGIAGLLVVGGCVLGIAGAVMCPPAGAGLAMVGGGALAAAVGGVIGYEIHSKRQNEVKEYESAMRTYNQEVELKYAAQECNEVLKANSEVLEILNKKTKKLHRKLDDVEVRVKGLVGRNLDEQELEVIKNGLLQLSEETGVLLDAL
jgi:hypothetical protein